MRFSLYQMMRLISIWIVGIVASRALGGKILCLLYLFGTAVILLQAISICLGELIILRPHAEPKNKNPYFE